MTLLENLRTQLRARLFQILALLVLVGNIAVFVGLTIPRGQQYDALSQQVQKNVGDLATRAAYDPAEALLIAQSQLDSAKTALASSPNNLITRAQSNEFLSQLYQRAADAGVNIVALTQADPATDPAATPSGKTNADGQANQTPSSVYEVRVFQLQVSGTMQTLPLFISHLRQAAVPSVRLTNLTILQDDAGAKSTPANRNDGFLMTLNIELYSSTFATGKAYENPPTFAFPTAVAIVVTEVPPSPTFVATATLTTTPTITPTLIPPTVEPLIPSPTPVRLFPTDIPTSEGSSTVAPDATGKPLVNITPTVENQCVQAAERTIDRLFFAQQREGIGTCAVQIWGFALTQPTDIIFEVQRDSGDANYRLELRDANTATIASVPSTAEGRGILSANAPAGEYTVRVIPLQASQPWTYTITIWRGVPTLAFGVPQNSYSTHNELGASPLLTAWRYSVAGVRTHRLTVTRTAGDLEFELVVVNAAGEQLGAIQSRDGSAFITLTTAAGDYQAQIRAVEGSQGSYVIRVD